jgi:type IV secretion system protein VirD4
MGAAGGFLIQFFFHVVVLWNRIKSFFQHSASLHHARFASLHELTVLLTERLDETSLLLGVSHFNHVLRVRSTESRRELGNVLIEAPTRGGKGLLATSQLLSWPHSVAVNDIKGELFTQTAGYRRTLVADDENNQQENVFVFDPRGYGHRYDPLLGKETEDQLLSAATQLLFKSDEGEGAIFTQRATVMLTQLFLAARAEGAAPFPYVRHLIRAGLPQAAARLNTINPALATQLLDVTYEKVNFSDRFLLSAWGTLTARIRPLLTETVIRSLSGSDFRAQDLLTAKHPITVYFRWPEQDLLAFSPLVRLVWGSLIDELTATYDNRKGVDCQPVLLLIDEAGRTAIPSLADHATTVVGRRISLWIAVQSLSQLNVVYGTHRATILRDNMESRLFYRPNDQETAEYLERCLGRKSDYAHSHTIREGEETSEGRMEQGIPLMTAQEIKQMPDERIIGFHRQLPPFLAMRMDWRRFLLLRERHAIPPPALPPLPELAETLPVLTPQGNGQLHGFINPDMRGENHSATLRMHHCLSYSTLLCFLSYHAGMS